MELKTPPPPRQSDDQLRYAAWLDRGTRVGLLVLVLAFAAYLLGWLPARIAPSELPHLWSQPLASYLQASGAPTGWSWLARWQEGDLAPLAGIAILASASMPCLLVVGLQSARRSDWRFAALCVAEVLVLLVAASGWLAGGH